MYLPKPITIVTGFLGAGKTTFINQLLAQSALRYCIVENEYGAINIDANLINTKIDDSIFELSNGCLCCSLNGDLMSLLKALHSRRDQYDHIIIETTGIAEPDAIAQSFIAEPDLQEYFTLNTCICIIDAENYHQNLKDRHEARAQISFAQAYYLSKGSSGQRTDVKMAVDTIFGQKKWINDESILALLTLNSFHPDQIIQNFHDSSHIDAPVKSYAFAFNQKFDLLKIRHWLNVLVSVQSETIYRIKGIIWVEGSEEPFILQSVRKQCVFQKGKISPNQTSQIVIIGYGIEKTVIEKYLSKCLCKP